MKGVSDLKSFVTFGVLSLWALGKCLSPFSSVIGYGFFESGFLSKLDSPFSNPNTSFGCLKSGVFLNVPLPKAKLTYPIFPLNPGNCLSLPTNV